MEAYLTKGWFWSSLRHKWSKQYKTRLQVLADNSYPMTQYRFFDEKTDDSINL
ncbi:MAG: hypothetical protein QM702_20370 [Rubrivivax sp.]